MSLSNILNKIIPIKRKVLKNLGALDKIDDGKPDFLKRLKISKTADKDCR